MPTLLPPLHEGHAPFMLHQAFDDALDAYEEWSLASAEPFVDFDGNSVAISAVFGRMRSCTDILPVRTLDAVRIIVGDRLDEEFCDDQITYSHAALLLRALCVDRLRA